MFNPTYFSKHDIESLRELCEGQRQQAAEDAYAKEQRRNCGSPAE